MTGHHPTTATPIRTPGRSRAILSAGIAISIVLTAAVLVGFEAAARAIDPYQGEIGLVRTHLTRGTDLTPGFRGRFGGQSVYVNALGFRSKEGRPTWRATRPEGTRRIMAFGDSFTFGQEIAFEDTYPYLVERQLATLRAGQRWEVINAGIPGYSTVEEFLYLRDTIDVYGADLVILEYTLNDAYGSPPETGVRELFKPVLDWLRTHSYAYHIVRNLVNPVTSPVVRSAPGEHPLASWYRQIYRPDASAWIATAGTLREIARTAADRGIPLIVLIYADMERPPAAEGRPDALFAGVYPFASVHRQVREALGVTDAEVIDTLDVLGTMTVGQAYETTRHPGPNANTRVADALATCILRIIEQDGPPGGRCRS